MYSSHSEQNGLDDGVAKSWSNLPSLQGSQCPINLANISTAAASKVRENILSCALTVVVLVLARVLGYLGMTMGIRVMGYLGTMTEDDDAGGAVSRKSGTAYSAADTVPAKIQFSALHCCYIIALLHCVSKIFSPIPFRLTITHIRFKKICTGPSTLLYSFESYTF
jgi:hypothetical protein